MSYMRAVACFLAVLLPGSALADTENLKKLLESRFEGEKVESVARTPYLNMYEVVIGDKIIYTDDKLTYIFIGSVLEAKTLRNLTQERANKLFGVEFGKLPLELAIKTVKGSGKRKMAVFSDPDCPYCQRLERTLQGVSDVTIYTFLYPIDSLHPDAARKSRAVWCSKDRIKAWDDLMLRSVVPDNKGDCDNPVAKTVELGQRMRVNGTPTIVFPNGQVVPGAIPKDQLERYLDASVQK